MNDGRDRPERGQAAWSEPAPPAADLGAGRPRRKYPTLLDRINNFFGRFSGAAGRRQGAKDTDPGR